MQKNLSVRVTSSVVVLFFSIAAGHPFAQTLTPAEEAEQTKALEQSEAKSRLAIYGWVESSFTGNFASPQDNQNFGRLFDDRSNRSGGALRPGKETPPGTAQALDSTRPPAAMK